MILRSLKLKNIRSYTEIQVNFEKGITLLAGDIGSGKTTLLLAIEFAIFGLLRGQTSGGTLLRHGTREGSVELSFELNKQIITIQRTLKKGTTINQEAGSLTINGEQTQGTATELKAKVLQLIGYPDELLSKSKSLIYRYTVYTPQEEMKHILYESTDERLDTLRKLFNIDKYKRIQENALTYMRELRNQDKLLATQLVELPSVEQELLKLDQALKEKQAGYQQLTQELTVQRKTLSQFQGQHQNQEQQLQDYRALKEKHLLNNSQVQHLQEQLQKGMQEREQLKLQIETLQKEIPPLNLTLPETLDQYITQTQSEIQKLQQTQHIFIQQETQEVTLQKAAQNLMQKIKQLAQCPTCLQNVDENHKGHIVQEQGNQILHSQQNLDQTQQQKKELQTKLDEHQKKLQELLGQRNQQAVNQVKLQNLAEKKQRLNGLQNEEQIGHQRLSLLQGEQEELGKRLAPYLNIEPQYQALRTQLEQQGQKVQQLEIQYAKTQNEAEQLKMQNTTTNERYQKLMQIQKRHIYLQEIDHWLQTQFLNIVETIEKNVLTSIYHEFNSYFTEWFEELIEDENLRVRLDEQFTPTIEQNGYETTIDNLSGGEKTSLALAYRLALNKVVNDFISTIQTKDLLILDEPTDGFSSEQLDQVRDVLQQLNLQQTILVSHETKLQSYADHVLYVRKHEHTSQIVS
ncbi:MAG: AAA family ATPase [Nanoarchaeota archaeon]